MSLYIHAHYCSNHTVRWKAESSTQSSSESASWKSPRSVKLRNIGGDVWKGFPSVEITLSSDIASSLCKSNSADDDTGLLNEQLLQSAMQKSVRRSEPEMAVRAAYTLARQNSTKFLRRLVVILVEDAYLHQHVQCVVWLMIATSLGYCWNDEQLKKCLALIQWMAKQSKIEDLTMETEFANWLPLQADGSVLALALRISYGGMRGDMSLLWRFVCRWSQRIATNSKHKIDKSTLELCALPKAFRSHQDLPRECVDFHVGREQYMSVLESAIKKNGMLYDKKRAQQALWHHRSGVYLDKTYIDSNKTWLECAMVQRDWVESKHYYDTVLQPILHSVDAEYLSKSLVKRPFESDKRNQKKPKRSNSQPSILNFVQKKVKKL